MNSSSSSETSSLPSSCIPSIGGWDGAIRCVCWELIAPELSLVPFFRPWYFLLGSGADAMPLIGVADVMSSIRGSASRGGGGEIGLDILFFDKHDRRICLSKKHFTLLFSGTSSTAHRLYPTYDIYHSPHSIQAELLECKEQHLVLALLLVFLIHKSKWHSNINYCTSHRSAWSHAHLP